MRHDFDGGKYTVIFDEKTGKMEALRHGSPWQELSGNNLIYFMLSAFDTSTQTVAQLQARVAELEDALRKLLDNGTAYPSAFEADFDFDVDTWAQGACQLLGLGDHRNA